VEVLEEL